MGAESFETKMEALIKAVKETRKKPRGWRGIALGRKYLQARKDAILSATGDISEEREIRQKISALADERDFTAAQNFLRLAEDYTSLFNSFAYALECYNTACYRLITYALTYEARKKKPEELTGPERLGLDSCVGLETKKDLQDYLTNTIETLTQRVYAHYQLSVAYSLLLTGGTAFYSVALAIPHKYIKGIESRDSQIEDMLQTADDPMLRGLIKRPITELQASPDRIAALNHYLGSLDLSEPLSLSCYALISFLLGKSETFTASVQKL